eukprot:CAMPEP_0185804880 /NCGR_PEP_ID=MMETSP1322-20130828/3519_2 /TAXON_ID=265543 /ORGANISM="Minutocellus polymorphus, Strain RCC2270" /LENGTH=173 /DNA_ID=CAMNT_0028500875 /DNA_START=96 /DNA_END=615 /DNA_ORIENTATION=-
MTPCCYEHHSAAPEETDSPARRTAPTQILPPAAATDSAPPPSRPSVPGHPSPAASCRRLIAALLNEVRVVALLHHPLHLRQLVSVPIERPEESVVDVVRDVLDVNELGVQLIDERLPGRQTEIFVAATGIAAGIEERQQEQYQQRQKLQHLPESRTALLLLRLLRSSRPPLSR